MPAKPSLRASIVAIVATVLISANGWIGLTAEPPVKATITADTLRGKIVWFGAALQRRLGVAVDPDALEQTIALETRDGRWYPIVKDARGRGFHVDRRLHDLDYELVVRRLPGTDTVQVIRVYTFHADLKYEFDYWCDICAIPMYELKECECCQGPIRWRERLMGPDGPGVELKPQEAR